MGYFKDMYGKREPEFVKGVLVGLMIRNDFPSLLVEDLVRDAVNEMAENPEDFDVDLILERGYLTS